MKNPRYSPEQIAFALRQSEAVTAATEVCRKMGMREQAVLQVAEHVRGHGPG